MSAVLLISINYFGISLKSSYYTGNEEMAKHETLGEFDLSKGDWKSYVERAKLYFAANDVTDNDKQRAIFLSACGDTTYRRIKDVLTPEAPGETSFKTIIEKMTQHLQPTPSQSVQRFRFNTRVRRSQESVEAYIAQLKQLAEHCKFGDAARLNAMLLDHLICGINHEKWQQRLLAEGDKLTYDKAHELLLVLEAAENEVKDLAGEKSVYQLRSRSTKSQPPSRPPSEAVLLMWRIAQRGQVSLSKSRMLLLPQNWPYCFSLSTEGKQHKSTQDSRPKATHSVAKTETTVNPEYPMHNVKSPSCRPISVEMTIQGMPVCLEVNTGATLSVMSHSIYQKTWPRKSAPPIVPSNAKLSTYTGQRIGVVGTIEVEAE